MPDKSVVERLVFAAKVIEFAIPSGRVTFAGSPSGKINRFSTSAPLLRPYLRGAC